MDLEKFIDFKEISETIISKEFHSKLFPETPNLQVTVSKSLKEKSEYR